MQLSSEVLLFKRSISCLIMDYIYQCNFVVLYVRFGTKAPQIYIPGGFLFSILIVLLCLTCIAIPLLGWLADAKLGNYRVFKINSYFTLAALLFVSLHILYFPMLNSIALQYTSEVVLVLVHAVGVASTLVCITTALQLGQDQMPDASSTNISSFISWFVFSKIFGFWIPKLLSNSLLSCTSLSEYRTL